MTCAKRGDSRIYIYHSRQTLNMWANMHALSSGWRNISVSLFLKPKTSIPNSRSHTHVIVLGVGYSNAIHKEYLRANSRDSCSPPPPPPPGGGGGHLHQRGVRVTLLGGRMVRAPGRVTYVPPSSGFKTRHGLIPTKWNAWAYALTKVDDTCKLS